MTAVVLKVLKTVTRRHERYQSESGAVLVQFDAVRR
jgi:hypothetical protein